MASRRSSKNRISTFDKNNFSSFYPEDIKWVIKAPSHPIPPFNLKVHPLVILIGWINCPIRSLHKYVELYNKVGFFTLSVVPPVLGHARPSYFKDSAINLLDFLLRSFENGQKRSIIFQVFSGNVVFLSHIQRQLNDKKYSTLLPYIKGEIYDSSPSELTESGGKTAIAAPFPNTFFYRSLISVVFKFLTFVVDVPKINAEFWFRFETSAIKDKPKLYIYSINDPVTPYLHVRKAINISEKNTDDIITLEFEKSDHVKHLLNYPYQYIDTLYRFWSQILNKNSFTSNNDITNSTNYQLLMKSFVSKY